MTIIPTEQLFYTYNTTGAGDPNNQLNNDHLTEVGNAVKGSNNQIQSIKDGKLSEEVLTEGVKLRNSLQEQKDKIIIFLDNVKNVQVMDAATFLIQFKKKFPEHKDILNEEVFEGLPYLQMRLIANIANEAITNKNENILKSIYGFFNDALRFADGELINIISVSFLEHLESVECHISEDCMPTSLKEEYDNVINTNRELKSDIELQKTIKNLLNDENNYI